MIRYDYDTEVLHVGERKYPVKRWHRSDYHEHPVRQAVIEFENRWALSIIWSALTYSDNYHYPLGEYRREAQPFVETPTQAEVGVLGPEPRVIPGMSKETVDYFASRYPTDPKVVEQMMEDRETALACDPFGWLDAADINALADHVMTLPSHPADVTAVGQDLEKAEWRPD